MPSARNDDDDGEENQNQISRQNSAEEDEGVKFEWNLIKFFQFNELK